MAKTKKRNPQDAALHRNINPLKRRLALLETESDVHRDRLKNLEKHLEALELRLGPIAQPSSKDYKSVPAIPDEMMEKLQRAMESFGGIHSVADVVRTDTDK